MKVMLPFRTKVLLTSVVLIAGAASGRVNGQELAARPDIDVSGTIPAKILIKPKNYDPHDPWEYTRRSGKLSDGMSATGSVWNRPAPDKNELPAPQLAASHLPLAAVSDESLATASTAGQGAPVPAASGPLSPKMSYIQAYNAVPFNRAEYEANPAYRHEAAMELMFGQMRPMTNVKQTVPYFSRYPDLFRYRYPVYPYPSTGSTTNYLFPYFYSQYAY